jgi:hypothetical protein
MTVLVPGFRRCRRFANDSPVFREEAGAGIPIKDSSAEF